MTWWRHLIILIVLIGSSHTKEETKKALIIAVDELKPEESDAIISDLTIKDQRTSPTYQRTERAPINKQLDYIIVRPEDLKTLKELADVSVEKPKHLRYPEPASDESYEVTRYSPYTNSEKETYTVKAIYPNSPREKNKHVFIKYPSRPAPPLSTYSGGDSSKEEQIYTTYSSPNSSPYKSTVPNDTPQHLTISSGHSYVDSKPTTYSNPSSYSSPSGTYEGSNPNSYTGTSSYSAPGSSYGKSKSSSYSAPSNYRTSKPNSYSNSPYYGSNNPSSYSGPAAYSGFSTYSTSKPVVYSGAAIYESPKPTIYSSPSGYENSKSSSYSGTSSYSEPKREYSKPSSYTNYPRSSYPPPKSSSYSQPHYDSSSENIHPDSEKYRSNPDTHDHSDKKYIYDEYSSPKSVSHSSGYETDPHYTPETKSYKSKYYDSSPVVEPVKHVSYDDLPTPYKNTPHVTEYEPSHDSPDDSRKPTSYSVPPKPPSHESYSYDSPKKSYAPSSSHGKERKYVSYDSYSSKPSYGKKLYGISINPVSYKPRTRYNAVRYTADHYQASPVPPRSYPKKNSYDSLKTTYESLHDPSSYEEPIKYNTYRYPSSYKASKVKYEPPTSYNSEHHPRSSLSDYKHESARPEYRNPISKSKAESEYVSPYDTPPSDDVKYKSSSVPSKYDDTTYTDGGISTSNYDSESPVLEYGSRYPSYRKSRNTNFKSNSPATSHFTLEDARSPEEIHHYGVKKPNHDPTESHSHYHHYEEDSSEIPPSHSAKKNYSPVRPAPEHDVLEQPRYPPLPKTKSKKHYDSEEDHSNERDGHYKTDSTYTDTKSYNPDYNTHSYEPTYSPTKTESRYPSSAENNYHYSDHSSEELDDEPVVYTKTTTTTYTKQHKDSSGDNSNGPSKVSYKTTSYPRYTSKGKNFVSSQPEYARPVYRDASERYPHSYSQTSDRNKSLPVTYSSLSQVLPPKRVEGVVYRSRQSYPNVKVFRRQKGYLPYKPHYSKSTSAYSLKPYEGVPSEIREKNVTRDYSVYDLPEKTENKKTNNLPSKKYIRYASSESKDQSDVSNEDSNHAAIPGEPGKDYPVLKEVPYNHFSCDKKLPGFYADVENRCQVYYQCSEEGRLQSFLCPNGTIFNQLTFVCEWWHNVDCSKSEKYFAKNNQLYKLPTPSKSKRTVRDNYRRPGPEQTDVSYYSDDIENSRALNNKRMRRSKVQYDSDDS